MIGVACRALLLCRSPGNLTGEPIFLWNSINLTMRPSITLRCSSTKLTHSYALSSFYIRPKNVDTRLDTAPKKVGKVIPKPNVVIDSKFPYQSSAKLINYFARSAESGNLKEAMNAMEMLVSNKMINTPKQFTKLMQRLEKYPEQNEEILKMMIKHKVQPDAFTYTLVMSGYGQTSNYYGMLKIFEEMQQQGIQPDTACYNTLIKWSGKMKKWVHMQQYFDIMIQHNLKPSHKTFQNIISSYAEAGDLNGMVTTFRDMQKYGLKPDIYIFTTMMKGLGNNGRIDDMEQLFNRLDQYQVYPNVELYTAMVSAFSKQKQVDKAIHYFQKMVESGIEPDRQFIDTMVNSLGKRLTPMIDVIAFAHDRGVLPPFALSRFLSLYRSKCEVDMNSFDALYLKMKDVKSFKLSPEDHALITNVIEQSRKGFPSTKFSSVPVPDFL